MDDEVALFYARMTGRAKVIIDSLLKTNDEVDRRLANKWLDDYELSMKDSV